MKKILLIPVCVVLTVSLFSQVQKEPTLEQKQALFMMNYAQYSAYKLKTYNNILALEDEYKILNNNMNLELIQDVKSVETITTLMDAIHTERKTNKNIERLKISVERRMNQAVYNMLPQVSSIISVGNTNPYILALNVAKTAGSMYMNYTQYKNELSQEYDDKMWEYEQMSMDTLNTINKRLLIYSYSLMQDYKISDNWRITETELEKIFNCLKDQNKNRVYQNLQYLVTDRFYEHFPMFWYHLAVAASEVGDDKNAIKYFVRFEKENLPIFRYDVTAVSAYKGLISIYLKDSLANRNEIIKKLAFIEQNKTSWNDFYFCALVYQSLGDIANARRLLERNISELSASIETQLVSISHLSQVAKGSVAPGLNEYDGIAISRTLLRNLDKETVSLDTVVTQYKKNTAALNEALYWFGMQPSAVVVNNSLADLRKIRLDLRPRSTKELIVTCTLPALWMLSSNTAIRFVCKNDAGKFFYYDLTLDNKAMKKHKTKGMEETELVYTAKVGAEYVSEEFNQFAIELVHTQYPVLLSYNVENIKKTSKNLLPETVIFNNKTYDLVDSTGKHEKSSLNSAGQAIIKIHGSIDNGVKKIQKIRGSIDNEVEKIFNSVFSENNEQKERTDE